MYLVCEALHGKDLYHLQSLEHMPTWPTTLCGRLVGLRLPRCVPWTGDADECCPECSAMYAAGAKAFYRAVELKSGRRHTA